VLTLASHFFEKADNERSGVLSTLRRHIRFLGRVFKIRKFEL